MLRVVLAVLLVAAALVAPRPAAAQDGASLIADTVFLNADGTLTAQGAVEVFYNGTRLKAGRITYSRQSDLLTIEGPITVTDGSGTTITADAASLSRDLTEGVLKSARLVLQDQLQLAANSMRRIQGRYTTLDKVVASSCQVCPSNPVPLWEIRARRVVHDQQTRQLTFDDAQFRVAGLPVFWLPRLRLPDPTVDRATGFLPPRFRTTSGLGFGLRLPYFITLGDSRDLTVTPYVTTKETRSADLRYRQAFRHGRMEWSGALSRDKLVPGKTRGYLFGYGQFDLARGYKLSFGVEAVTDRAYLLDYGVSDKDRLASGIDVTRTRRNQYLDLRFFDYTSIRSGEVNATLPTLVGDAVLQRRFTPALVGGEGGLRLAFHSQRRASTQTADLNGDGVPDGRDVSRLTAALDWRRNWVARNGIVASVMAEAVADFYAVSQDPGFPGGVARLAPVAAVELRWPWVRSSGRASEILEPVIQVVWSPDSLKRVPNEDSRLVEFDEGNLFSLNRFPGEDDRERGTRANIGLSYTRIAPAGWSLGVIAGRVIRARDLGQFTAGSGLSGSSSDWLVAAQIDSADGLSLINRAVFDDAFSLTRDEFRLGLDRLRYDVAASYIWQVADPAENRPRDTNELTLDAAYTLSPRWRGTLGSRYDFVADRAVRAGVGLQYQSDCVGVDLSLSRRFTSSTTLRPVTDFSLSVSLSGFGTGTDGRSYRRVCGR